jgi:hypothetical protein
MLTPRKFPGDKIKNFLDKFILQYFKIGAEYIPENLVSKNKFRRWHLMEHNKNKLNKKEVI